MARGKYANAAQARAVREDALAEVEAGRRAIARLTKENAEIAAQLTAERLQHAERVKSLGAMLETGSTPEVEAMRVRVREAEDAARGARRAAGLAIASVLRRRSDVTYTLEAAAEFCQALGLKPSDIFDIRETERRDLRRETAKGLRRKASLAHQVKGMGADPMGLG